MFKVHLREVLNQHGYTLYDLSDAILDLGGVSESTVYRFARGGQNLTLRKLELILAAVRSLTGQPIRLSDLISDEENTPSGSEGDTPSEALVPLLPREAESDIDEVWELVARRARPRAPGRLGRRWLAAGAGAFGILGLVLLGSADWELPPGLPAANPTDGSEVTTVAAATSPHVGAEPAVHMELKKKDSEGHAAGRPVCETYSTPANTRPTVTNCPDGAYVEQLFDADWKQVGERDVVVGSSTDPDLGNPSVPD